jgi:hypothetical protein
MEYIITQMDHIRNQQPTSNRTLVNEGIFEMNSSVRASERSRLSRVQHSKKNKRNNNVHMRRYHNIKQPGFDVQRFGHK